MGGATQCNNTEMESKHSTKCCVACRIHVNTEEIFFSHIAVVLWCCAWLGHCLRHAAAVEFLALLKRLWWSEQVCV